jgi:hypothetical protein
VLDIGAGPGKFCAIGACVTKGLFIGVEQRRNLVEAAKGMIRSYALPRVKMIHANMTEIQFGKYDAFYLFNPFYENLSPSLQMDTRVVIDRWLYTNYIGHVRRELGRLPPGTRVATYWSDGEEIPDCYECVDSGCGGKLKMWIKLRTELLNACSAASVPIDSELCQCA